MELLDFFGLVWPKGEHFFVVHISADGTPRHIHVQTPEAAKAAVARGVGAGKNVYYAMASYREEKYKDNGKIKRRTQANVDRLKCLWIDLDCKGKNDGTDYPDQEAALNDIYRMCSESGIQRPTLTVNSGYGVHAYWVFEEDIPRDAWIRIAAMWRATLDEFGIKHDRSCTEDCARILRPITSLNYKQGAEPRPVEVLTIGNKIKLESFTPFLVPAVPKSLPKQTLDPMMAALNEVAESIVEYPPSSFVEVVRSCGLMREVAKARGNVSEPLWYASLGLAKHTIEADKAIHIVSSGHPGYSKEDTEAKARQWAYGPPTCVKLESVAGDLSSVCATCPSRGHVKSPIQLGHTHVKATEEQAVITTSAGESIQTEEIPAMPQSMQGFRWNGLAMEKAVLDEEATKKTGNNMYEWVPFCSFFFYPHTYFRNETDELVMVWKLRERAGVWREFDLSGSAMGAGGQALFKEMGAQGVLAMHGRKLMLESYVTSWFAEIKRNTLGTETYMHFGWHGDGFLLGDTMFTPDGEKKVRVGGDARRMVHNFVPKGTRERWADLIDKAYNLPGQEQYQFIIGTGFGCPLVHMMGFSGGITVSALSFDSGQGKTTAEQLAVGIYGNGRSGSSTALSISTQQATPKFVFAHAGVMHNLPIVVDEITNIRAQDISDTLYTFSGGTPRMGLRVDGRMSRTRFGWSSMMLTSSNKSLVSTIATHKPSADAEMARLLEFDFRPVSPHSKETADEMFRELYDNYGAAGREYIAYITKNADSVRSMLGKLQKTLDKRCNLSRRDRYWSICLTATIGGLFLAKHLGLVKFDIDGVINWVAGKIGSMRSEISASTSDASEMVGRMLSEVSPGILVTNTFAGDKNAFVSVIREPRGAITGRIVVDEGRMYIPATVVQHWAATHFASVRDMIQSAHDKGWLLTNDRPRIYLGRGTTHAAGQTRCYVFNLAAMEGCAAHDPVVFNVVSLMHAHTG